jgi:hypothetical protein
MLLGIWMILHVYATIANRLSYLRKVSSFWCCMSCQSQRWSYRWGGWGWCPPPPTAGGTMEPRKKSKIHHRTRSSNSTSLPTPPSVGCRCKKKRRGFGGGRRRQQPPLGAPAAFAAGQSWIQLQKKSTQHFASYAARYMCKHYHHLAESL